MLSFIQKERKTINFGKEKEQVLLQYLNDFGGVRRQRIPGATTKDSPGTRAKCC